MIIKTGFAGIVQDPKRLAKCDGKEPWVGLPEMDPYSFPKGASRIFASQTWFNWIAKGRQCNDSQQAASCPLPDLRIS